MEISKKVQERRLHWFEHVGEIGEDFIESSEKDGVLTSTRGVGRQEMKKLCDRGYPCKRSDSI